MTTKENRVKGSPDMSSVKLYSHVESGYVTMGINTIESGVMVLINGQCKSPPVSINRCERLQEIPTHIVINLHPGITRHVDCYNQLTIDSVLVCKHVDRCEVDYKTDQRTLCLPPPLPLHARIALHYQCYNYLHIDSNDKAVVSIKAHW